MTIRTESAVKAQVVAKFYDPTVAAGTVHGLVEPNGAGKITLLAAASVNGHPTNPLALIDACFDNT